MCTIANRKSHRIIKTIHFIAKWRLSIVVALIFSLFYLGCKEANSIKNEKLPEKANNVINEAKGREGVVEIITNTMDLQVDSQIPSGWTTFRYLNKSNETHFFVLEKLPEGKTLADSRAEVIPIFQDGMDLLNQGKTEEGFAEFDRLPAWFFEVVFNGGVGLVSPGGVAETTLQMSPGLYVMECYVKMPNGKFHSAQGMVAQLEVTDNDNGQTAPKAEIDVSISAMEGIVIENKINSGLQTIAVHFKDQKPHEHFIGHDVHLVKLTDDSDIVQLNTWMNWADPEAFTTPAPEGLIFLGGVQEMPQDSKGFFSAELEKGQYALVAEVPDPLSKHMLVTFMVE